MSYPRENYIKVKQLLAQRRQRANDTFEAHRTELCEKYPAIASVEQALSATGLNIYAEALKGQDGLEERIARLQKENGELIAARESLLKQYGYPTDYLDIVYVCPLCRDEGSINGRMCSCMRKELTMLGFETSGIGKLIKKQSFETFDLSYYSFNKEVYKQMERTLSDCRQYAEEFSGSGDPSLFFAGGTGLGKTHLCTSIAKRVIERGFDVVYETAANIFSGFEQERFNRSYRDESENKTDRYFGCELLIIDDLGTELSNQFTVSVLYNLINTRHNADKSMIINTNLSKEDLMNRFEQRIYSRLAGEFIAMRFSGRDIRMQKIINEKA